MLVPLKGGDSINFSWNQRDNNGKQVSDGEYIVVVYYYEKGEGRELSKSFKIISPTWEWKYHNFSVNRYVKIKSKIYIPKKIEIGKKYEIPIYFSRRDIIWLTGNAKRSNTSLNLNIFVGLGKTSNGTVCRISIELTKDNRWQIDIPLKENNYFVLPITSSEENEYVQILSLQMPPYRYVIDVPTDWDGPYKIIMEIKHSSSQSRPPYSIIEPIPLPIVKPDGEVLYNVTFGKVKIIDTPLILNTISPTNLSIKTGISFGSTISSYNIKRENDNFYLFNPKYKIKLGSPFVINNSKLFLTSNLTFGTSTTPINIAPETIVAKERLKSVKSITLRMEDFTPIYEIKGYKKEKLLGIFSVKELVTIKVNAVTGRKISEKEPWWGFLTT